MDLFILDWPQRKVPRKHLLNGGMMTTTPIFAPVMTAVTRIFVKMKSFATPCCCPVQLAAERLRLSMLALKNLDLRYFNFLLLNTPWYDTIRYNTIWHALVYCNNCYNHIPLLRSINAIMIINLHKSTLFYIFALTFWI